MGHERWFRGQHDGQGRPFDWLTAARQHGIPEKLARTLYERAVQQAYGSTQGSARELYLALLADARQAATRPAPGKVTRTMRIQSGRSAQPRRSAHVSPLTRQPIAPGKRTAISYIEPPRDLRNQDHSRAEPAPLAAMVEVFATGRLADPAGADSRATAGQWDMAAVDRDIAMSLGFLDMDHVSEGEPGHDAVDDAAFEQPAAGATERDDHAPQPLAAAAPAAFMSRMAYAFGQRFDHVLIHRDSPVPAGRQAFSRGHDIHLGAGAPAPDSPEAERILAHELAHVAQRGLPATGWQSRSPSISALEVDAHQAALHALAGQAAAVRLAAPAGLALGYTDDPDAVDEQTTRRARPGGAPGGAERGAPGDRGPGGRPAAGPAAGPEAAPRPEAAPAPAPAPTPTGARAPAAPALPSGAGPASRPAAAPAASAGGNQPLLDEAPDTLSGAAQGRLTQIDAGAQSATERVTELPTADESTTAARGAVTEPQEEQDARAQAGVARAIDDRPPPSPEIEAACERIREVIRSKRPPDEESLVDAQPREMAAEAGGEMSTGIETRAGSVREGYADMETTPPGQPGREAVPVELPPEQVDVPDMDAAAGVPDELTAEEVSLEADVEAQNRRITEAGMTTEPAQLVEDGPIADARTGLTDLEAAAAADPQQVLADQTAAIAVAASDMQALQEAAEQALSQARGGTVGTLGTLSTEITGSEEEQRAQAGQRMQAIFERARSDVDALLSPLSEAALGRWEAGVDQLATNFESSLSSVKQRIEERYRTEDDWDPFDEIGAGLTQAWDYVAGLPDWVVEEYDRAEQTFADGCTSLITDISRDVNAVIEDCQAIIQQARDDIDAIVTSLPEELQAWAQGEAARLGTELDALESQVTETRQTLNQDLIDRSNAAVQEVRERVHELREAAKGVIGRIGDAIAAFLEDPGRAIVNGLLQVLGIPPANFWALVDQLGNVIDGIADDPMGFANNLMAGVGQGFEQFFGNFPLHLGQGLFAWLFSKMGEAGVTMPRDFSIPSIVSLVLDVMGINWERIRMLLARHIGEQNVAHIEQAYDIITTFIARGPLGLVELMREQLDPASIVDMIRETAIRYLMESIVTRVATRILMMLNPAGAILQAIEAIYRVLSWIYENAARIFTLIEAVVNGAAQVLAGNVGGLAALVERALVGLMVPVIDFLADCLGLGGIPAAIRDLVLGLQARVERILDRVIAFIAQRARAFMGAMGVGGDTESQDGQPGADSPLPPVPFEAHTGEDGEAEPHRIYVDESGSTPEIMIASDPQQALNQIRRGEFQRLLAGPDHVNTRIQITDLLVQARNLLASVQSNAGGAQGNASGAQARERRQQALRNMQQVSQLLADLGASYPVPAVGTHAALTAQASGEQPPDGRTRHSHHVPADALGEVMHDELTQAVQRFESRYPDNRAVANVVARLREAAAAMHALLDNHGEGLSAILLHPDTHKHADVNIHGRNIAPLLEAELQRHEQAYGVRRLRIMNTTGQQLLVNPRKSNWRQFLRECETVVADRSRQTGALSGARSGSGLQQMISETRDQLEQLDQEELQELTQEVLLSAKSTLRQTFVEAYASGEAAVRAALGASRLDGANPTSVLPALRREAQVRWQPFHTSIRF
jgi:hypothetical protein